MVVGIDEVGRGAWAGPLVVGAVVLGDTQIVGLTDSKKLSAKRRQALAREIKQSAKSIGLGWVSAETIDKIGLSKALTLATKQALAEINTPYSQIIIDGTVNFIDDTRVTTMKQADLLVPSVSAASIMAKVARDYYMNTILHQELPHYRFDRHVGYGTATHTNTLREHGPSYVHRMSFKPVLKALGKEIKIKTKPSKVQSTIGRKAEENASLWLGKNGYEVINTNWRTKVCEIDIVARRDSAIYFIEVKYRKNDTSGDGLAAITPKKLQQMIFSTRVWQQFNPTVAYDSIQLGIISMSGNPPVVEKFLQLS